MRSLAGARQRRLVMPLRSRFAPPAVAPAPVRTGERLPPFFTWVALLVALPLFAQCFHYLNELPPTYLLSKAWPVLTLPLALQALVWMKLPAKRVYVLLMAYTFGLTPLISMIQLGNGFFDALTTTVKVWPLTYYFALSVLLAWLAPAAGRTRSVCLALGYATFALMILLWVLAPASWYNSDPSLGKLMLFEEERGYRIYMPLFFGMLLIFYLVRSFMQRPHWGPLLGVAAAFALELVIYKQRASIGAAVLVVGYGVLMGLPASLRRLAIGAGCLMVPLAISVFLLRSGGDVAGSLGGSLSVRQNSFALATGYLGTDVWRWAFGVGATTRFSTVTLADIFGNSQFYIADLGWVGVVFEYGIVGALLIFGTYAWSFLVVRRAAKASGDAFAQALSDYILFLLVTSAVYSLVLTPGELGVVMALAVSLDRSRNLQPVRPPQPGGATLSRSTHRRMIGISHVASVKKTVR